MINASNRLEEFIEKDKVIPVETLFEAMINLNPSLMHSLPLGA